MSIPLLCTRRAITSLKREPRETCTAPWADDLQESQLLYNELFRPLREEGNWCYGEALEQPYHTEKGWIGYPGWVMKSALVSIEMTEPQNAVVIHHETEVFSDPLCSGQALATLPLGCKVRVSPDHGARPGFSRILLHSGQTGLVRNGSLRVFDGRGKGPLDEDVIGEVIGNAFLFLGTPYLWGGMSLSWSRASGTVYGVDCSALVFLSYRLSGIDVPRNAHDQWVFAQPVEGEDLRAGDLVFIARAEAPELVRHVMICTGFESMIEASETGRTVSETTFKEKFGLPRGELALARFVSQGRSVCFGRIDRGFDTNALRRT